MARVVVPAGTAVLAFAAGAIHLAHNYLAMQAPAGSSAPPTGAGAAMGGGGSGLMGLVMPHLSQVMVLNFVGFVGLGILLVAIARLRPWLRATVDVLLAGLSLATLYAWSAMGRSNPSGTGTMALVVELLLIVIALGDALYVSLARAASRRFAAQSA